MRLVPPYTVEEQRRELRMRCLITRTRACRLTVRGVEALQQAGQAVVDAQQALARAHTRRAAARWHRRMRCPSR